MDRVAWVGTEQAPCYAGVPAGAPTFPIDAWKKQKIQALALLGDALCSEDAVTLAVRNRLEPALFLGLESAHVWAELPARQRHVVTAGAFPWTGSEKAPAAMRAWKDRSGKGPTWYEALGHDAALLAAAGLSALPLERTDDANEVAERHGRASVAVAEARAPLWSSGAQGFGGQRTLPRTFGVVKVEGLAL
jgi:ABC-type branched-subunit amino acid transport system substrate-binding protein